MWQELATAFCLLLVIEGIIPFLYPKRWREMVMLLAEVDDKTMRMVGFGSMAVGTALLYIVN